MCIILVYNLQNELFFMFLDFKKSVILVISSILLYYTLISPNILPRVTVCSLDAFCITIFEILTILTIRYLSMLEAKALETEILVQYTLMNEIINNTSLAMYIKKPDGTILLANNKLSELLKIKPEDMIGRCVNDLYVDSNLYDEEDKKIIDTKQAIKSDKFLRPKNNNKGHWYRVTKTPVLNRYNQVVSIVVIFENIDADKNLEERKKTFVATMTHDLKTPTLAQINALDLLLKNCFGEVSNIQRDILNQIKSSCKYMSNLIFTILDTYLYDNGSVKLKYESFNIEELINETINEISNLLIEKQQTIKIHSSASSNIVIADKFQIKRVILNLISNANNHSFPNSEIEVYLSDTDNSNSINIDITNKSHYISDDALSDIFTKYKQTQNAKFRKTSTGLGLYLSKQIIESHNGEIHATSSKRKGTSTFGFSIPKSPIETTNSTEK